MCHSSYLWTQPASTLMKLFRFFFLIRFITLKLAPCKLKASYTYMGILNDLCGTLGEPSPPLPQKRQRGPVCVQENWLDPGGGGEKEAGMQFRCPSGGGFACEWCMLGSTGDATGLCKAPSVSTDYWSRCRSLFFFFLMAAHCGCKKILLLNGSQWGKDIYYTVYSVIIFSIFA